jgi:septin family protein
MILVKLILCCALPPGRTTFVNTLCGKTVLPHKDSDDPNSAHVEEGVKIKPITVGMRKAVTSWRRCWTEDWPPLELELDEEGTRISLTIVDTPGFGDQIDNEARCVLLRRSNDFAMLTVACTQFLRNRRLPRTTIWRYLGGGVPYQA